MLLYRRDDQLFGGGLNDTFELFNSVFLLVDDFLMLCCFSLKTLVFWKQQLKELDFVDGHERRSALECNIYLQ